MPSKHITTLSLLTLLLFSSGLNPLLAVTSDWTGTTSGDWNDTTNWSAGIPGVLAADQDSASFPNTTSQLTVNLNTPTPITPGLNLLSFTSASNYTINGSTALQFNPTTGGLAPQINVTQGTQTINAPITINGTTLTINPSSGSTLRVTNTVQRVGSTTANILFSGAGTLNIAPTVAANLGISINGTFTQQSGTVSTTNTLPSSSGATTGLQLNANGAFTIDSGATFTSSNSGAISGTPGIGVSFNGGAGILIPTQGVMTFSSGSTVTNTNSGTVTDSSSLGVQFSATSVQMNGTYTATNRGNITTANGRGLGGNTGCVLRSNGLINITGTTTLSNSGAISNNGTAVSPATLAANMGSVIRTDVSMTINSTATVNQTNTGTLSYNSTGTSISSGQLIISGPTINVTNDTLGNVTDSAIGSTMESKDTLSFSSGIVNVTNNGTVSAQAIGGAFRSINKGTLSGGSLILTNTGAVSTNAPGFASTGALAQFGSIDFLGTTFSGINTNTGSVSSTDGIANGTILDADLSDINVGPQSGIITISNSGTIAGGKGSVITATNNLNFSGSTINNTNTGSISSTGVGTFISTRSGNIVISGGTLNTINDILGSVTGSGTGSSTQAGGQFLISGGTINVTNKATVNNTGIGARLNSIGNFTISNGTTTVSNTGNITAGTGSLIQSNSIFSLSGGLLNFINSASSSGGIGTLLFSKGEIHINGGNFTSTNTGNLSGVGTGCIIQAPTILIQPGANVTNTNQAGLTGNVIGCLTTATNLFNITGGTFSNINNGALSNGKATEINSFGNLQVSGGTLRVTNNGALTGGIGCNISSPTITVSGGTLQVENAQSATITGGIGAIMQAPTSFNISDGTANFINQATVSTTGQGIALYPQSITQTGGAINITNNGICNDTIGIYPAIASTAGGTGVTVSGGQMNLTNTKPVYGNQSNIFVEQFHSDFNINGGQVNFTNLGTCEDGVNNYPTGVAYFLYKKGKMIVNGGTFTASNSATVVNGPAVYVYSGGSTILNSGTINLSNSGTLESGTSLGILYQFGSFEVNGGNFNISNSGAISSASSAGTSASATSITINGGTVTVEESQGAVTGIGSVGSFLRGTTINVNGGILKNNDSVRSTTLTVGNNGIVTGKGIFSDRLAGNTGTFINGGTVIPGDIGTNVGYYNQGLMTIMGEYIQTSSGTLNVNVLNINEYSQLSVLGAMNAFDLLDGGTLRVTIPSGANISPADRYKIAFTEDPIGVMGTFGTVINPTGYRASVEYFDEYIILTLIPTTPSFIGNYTLPILSSINETNIRLGRKMSAIHDRLDKRASKSAVATLDNQSQSYVASNNLLDLQDMNEKKEKQPWNVYAGPTGNFGNISANGTQSGFDYWSAGALAGFDYTFANAGVGFMANYDYIKGHEDTTGQFHINEAHGSLYGTISPKRLPELSFNAILGGSYEWYGFDRTITTSTEKPVGRTRGGEFDALLGVEYTIENRGKMTKGLKIVPLVSAQYVYLRVGEYDETNGGSYNFHYDSQTVQSLRSTLGSRLGYTWTKDSSFKLVSELDFAWQREFMNHNLEVGYTTIAFVQPNSTAIIPGSGRNLILAGIDLEAVFKEKYGCNASYDFEWNEQFLDHSFQVGFNANF